MMSCLKTSSIHMETKKLTKGLESQDGRDCLKCLGDISASEKQ